MSVHSIFKELLNESVFAKKDEKTDGTSVNEGTEGDAVGNLTRNNLIPSLFNGPYLGLRIPSAVRKGMTAPYWGYKYFTYPFAGIDGASDNPAITARQGSTNSFLVGRLRSESNRFPVVGEILDRQVREGTGIPSYGFIIFPQQTIASVATKDARKSMSYMMMRNLRDNYSLSTYPYNVQQALSVDEKGTIYPNPNKKGGVVLSSTIQNAQSSTSDLMYLDRLTKEDLIELNGLKGPNRARFATEITGDSNLNFKRVGGLLGSYMSAIDKGGSDSTMKNPIPNGNKDFGDFDGFAMENQFMEDDGTIDFMGIREWILEADAKSIVDKLIIPYLLMTPFELTYCWRKLPPNRLYDFRNEIRLYNALTTKRVENGSFDMETDAMEFDIEGSDGGQTAMGESEEVGISTNTRANINRKGYMDVFAYAVEHHASTITLKPTNSKYATLRDDDRKVTKSSGQKRTFVRVLFEDTELKDIDRTYCPKDRDGTILSHRGVLDYSEIFRKYQRILEPYATEIFDYYRLVGYAISYRYDPEVERTCTADGSQSLFDCYNESPLAELLDEPTTFDVIYVLNKDGNFIFTGYSSSGVAMAPTTDAPPPTVDENGLYVDLDKGLHSVISHDRSRVVVPYAYNTKVH